MRNLCQSRSRIITLLNGENQALMLQSGHWTHGKFLQPTRPAKMTALGSVSEWQEFFRSAAKPPYRFRVRASAPLMTENGWIASGLLSGGQAGVADTEPISAGRQQRAPIAAIKSGEDKPESCRSKVSSD